MSQVRKLKHTPRSLAFLIVGQLISALYFILGLSLADSLAASLVKGCCLVVGLGLIYQGASSRTPYTPDDGRLAAPRRRRRLVISNTGIALLVVSIIALIALPLIMAPSSARLLWGLLLTCGFLGGSVLMLTAELSYQKVVSGPAE